MLVITVLLLLRHGRYPTTADANGDWEVQMNCCDAATNKTVTVFGV